MSTQHPPAGKLSKLPPTSRADQGGRCHPNGKPLLPQLRKERLTHEGLHYKMLLPRGI